MAQNETTALLNAMRSEAVSLRENADATRDGIAVALYPAKAELIVMIQLLQADSLERIIRTVETSDG